MAILKHVDFEVPNFGELAPGALMQEPTPGATLAQSAQAAFPDRGATGLLVDLVEGAGGAWLNHDLGAEHEPVFVRVLLGCGSAAGGAVRVLGGRADDGSDSWWLTYDAQGRAVTLQLKSGQNVWAPLNALAWHCIEVKVDTAGGEAALWVNGFLQTTTPTSTVLPTREVWLGAAQKDEALAGTLYLDEWVIGESAIGQVIVPPKSDYGDDPARWLVAYSSVKPESAVWAEAYRAARGVPLANLLAATLPTLELMSGGHYASLANTIDQYLADTGLVDQVAGILLGYGVPGYVDFGGHGIWDPTPAMLHRPGAGGGVSFNPNAEDAPPVRPTMAVLGGDRLTARIDGPDLASAMALIDRASALMAEPVTDVDAARLWLALASGGEQTIDYEVGQMLGWAQGVDRQRLRLRMELAEGTPATVERDLVFWGLPRARPVRRRRVCLLSLRDLGW